MQYRRLISILALLVVLLTNLSSELIGQSNWDWRDPVDVGSIDLGDNKVLAYNLLGLGAIFLFDKSGSRDTTLIQVLSLDAYREYRRAPLSTIWVADYRRGKMLRSYLSWGGGVRCYNASGQDIQTVGMGGYIWFGWHIVNKERWRLTYDNGVGPNCFFNAFPNGGTHFNFTTHYGIQLEFRISQRWLQLQISNIHISNADIKGRERNPAVDGLGIRLGYSF